MACFAPVSVGFIMDGSFAVPKVPAGSFVITMENLGYTTATFGSFLNGLVGNFPVKNPLDDDGAPCFRTASGSAGVGQTLPDHLAPAARTDPAITAHAPTPVARRALPRHRVRRRLGSRDGSSLHSGQAAVMLPLLELGQLLVGEALSWFGDTVRAGGREQAGAGSFEGQRRYLEGTAADGGRRPERAGQTLIW